MSHIDLSEHPAYKAMLRMDGEAAKAVAAAGLDPLLAEEVTRLSVPERTDSE
ncbi:hypothetical protein [Kocuria palustris]|uniref:hypothetical protein n=1 Tax=Kocuria palustris TaxID=71999 RepID=UPI002300BB04|nr:hypothetical protein [Kocuria palustris]